MIDGILVSVPAGASTIVIGGQTITSGGSLITLSNHDVLSLGPSGLEIQMPGGGVTTVTVAASTAAPLAADSGTTSTSMGLASIIASGMSYGLQTMKPANTNVFIVGGLGNGNASTPQSQTPAAQLTTGLPSQATTGSPSQATTIAPPQITASSGSQVDIKRALVWMACCLLAGWVQWM
jgi:hypothetical protein